MCVGCVHLAHNHHLFTHSRARTWLISLSISNHVQCVVVNGRTTSHTHSLHTNTHTLLHSTFTFRSGGRGDFQCRTVMVHQCKNVKGIGGQRVGGVFFISILYVRMLKYERYHRGHNVCYRMNRGPIVSDELWTVYD